MKRWKMAFVTALPMLGIFVGTYLAHAVQAQEADPSPRVQFLGWEFIEGVPNKAGVPTRASVFVDKATHQEVLCLGQYDSGTFSCYQTGRKR